MIITSDYETFFSDDFTLKKLTTEAYIRDPRFKTHGLALKFDASPAQWCSPEVLWNPEFRRAFEQSAALCHHAQFDGLIYSHHYNLRPALWLDTLSMARIAVPHERHSLDNLSKFFGMQGKQHHKLTDVKGVRDPSPPQLQTLGEMSCDDADKTYKIFTQIRDFIPAEEFRVIDMTIRMFTEPCLMLDEPKMRVYHGKVVAQKQDALAELGLTKTDLGQDETVAAAYRKLGVEPDKKTTAKGNVKYAFAKTDQFMRDMLEDEDERVANLTSARLGIKSTLNETRCERLLGMTQRGGTLPVYLRYAGAHPTRWSGGDSLNWQNFPRNERDGSPGEIRRSILAPPGYAIVVADESQVECRVLNWLAGQWDVIEKFRNREDPYIGIASQFYGEDVYKPKKDDPRKAEMEKMRGTGKQLELSCVGPDTLVLTDRGYTRILDVTAKHRVWDGVEWVKHRGVVARGHKQVLKVCGVQLTPDHLVLCGQNWLHAQELSGSTLFRALESGRANLPLQATKSASTTASSLSSFNVHAAPQNIRSTRIISSLGALRAAIHALKRPAGTGLSDITATQTWCRRMMIDVAYLAVSPRLLTAAPIRNHAAGLTTEAGASRAFGSATDARSWRTSLSCQARSTLRWISTALTTRAAMSLEICGLFRTNRIAVIGEQSSSSGRKMQTYDLAFAGPRNRYTIASDAGPLIVHNCGYGASGPSIVETAKRGTYGPPVYLTDEDGDRAAKLYRSTHRAVTNLWWQTAEEVLRILQAKGQTTWGPMEISDGAIWMPNGLPLWYTDFRIDDNGEMFCFIRGRWRKMWGSKLVQHVCEGLARTIISQAALRVQRETGWRAVNTTHDELMYIVPQQHAEKALDYLCVTLRMTPEWAPGLPLDAEGAFGERYSK